MSDTQPASISEAFPAVPVYAAALDAGDYSQALTSPYAIIHGRTPEQMAAYIAIAAFSPQGKAESSGEKADYTWYGDSRSGDGPIRQISRDRLRGAIYNDALDILTQAVKDNRYKLPVEDLRYLACYVVKCCSMDNDVRRHMQLADIADTLFLPAVKQAQALKQDAPRMDRMTHQSVYFHLQRCVESAQRGMIQLGEWELMALKARCLPYLQHAQPLDKNGKADDLYFRILNDCASEDVVRAMAPSIQTAYKTDLKSYWDTHAYWDRDAAKTPPTIAKVVAYCDYQWSDDMFRYGRLKPGGPLVPAVDARACLPA